MYGVHTGVVDARAWLFRGFARRKTACSAAFRLDQVGEGHSTVADWEALPIGARTEGPPRSDPRGPGAGRAARRFRGGRSVGGERSMSGLFGYPDTFHSPRVIGKSKRQVRLNACSCGGLACRPGCGDFSLVPLLVPKFIEFHKPLKTSGLGRRYGSLSLSPPATDLTTSHPVSGVTKIPRFLGFFGLTPSRMLSWCLDKVLVQLGSGALTSRT